MILLPRTTPIELHTVRVDTPMATTQAPPNWVQRVRLVVPESPCEGKFRVSWSVEWTMDNINQPGFIRLELDDTTLLACYTQSVATKYTPGTPLTEYWYCLSGQRCVLLSAAAHVMDLDMAVGGNKTILVRCARIDALRV